ncbi:MAG TPA: hypothetical protein PKV93_11790, partial [Fervidobacterium sp.]|nr:hypothetical protein [Fervidobacterium sp.]
EINFQVVQLEDGSYQLINPFEDLTSVIENLNATLKNTSTQINIIIWSIQQIGNALTNIIEDYKAVFEPAPEKETGQTLNYAKTLENWKNYDENVKKLKALQTQLALTETAATVSMGTIGALIGGLLGGPLGALLGGALGVLGGQAIGEATTEEVRKQIEELQAQLKVTFQELANALGTSIGSVATALERAFSADTYEEFLNNFSDSLEDMTKTALIRAFLASETMQPLLENLSNAITLAVLDGVLSPEELEVLKQLESQVTDVAKPFFDALIQLFPPTTAGTGTIENQTVGGIVRSSISEQTGGMLVGLMNSLNLVTQDIRDILKNGTVNVYVVNATDYARYTTESGR